MSDCFNHEADAWDDLIDGQTANEGADNVPDRYLTNSCYPKHNADSSPKKPKKVKCQYCGKKKLRWVETPSGWRLMTKKKKFHVCEAYLAKKAH